MSSKVRLLSARGGSRIALARTKRRTKPLSGVAGSDPSVTTIRISLPVRLRHAGMDSVVTWLFVSDSGCSFGPTFFVTPLMCARSLLSCGVGSGMLDQLKDGGRVSKPVADAAHKKRLKGRRKDSVGLGF